MVAKIAVEIRCGNHLLSVDLFWGQFDEPLLGLKPNESDKNKGFN